MAQERLVVVDDEENIDPYADMEAEFEFNGRKKRKRRRHRDSDDIEIIKAALRDLDSRNSIEDLDALTKYFMNMITNIKSAPMSNKIKTNRINFFATLR